MRYCIIIPIHGRKDLTRRVIKHYSKFKDAILICVVSNDKDRENLSQFGERLIIVDYPNDSLIDKFNQGFVVASQFRLPAAIVGSDDIISENYFEFGVRRVTEYSVDCIGLLDCYIVSLKTKEVSYWGGYHSLPNQKDRTGESIGAGRIFSAKFLEKVNWNPFFKIEAPNPQTDESNLAKLSKYDGVIENTYLAKHGFSYWNIKSGNEINPFHVFKVYDNFIDVSLYQDMFWNYFASLDCRIYNKIPKLTLISEYPVNDERLNLFSEFTSIPTKIKQPWVLYLKGGEWITEDFQDILPSLLDYSCDGYFLGSEYRLFRKDRFVWQDGPKPITPNTKRLNIQCIV